MKASVDVQADNSRKQQVMIVNVETDASTPYLETAWNYVKFVYEQLSDHRCDGSPI